MDRALVKYRISDGVVVGTWRGGGTLPTNDSLGFALLEVSLEEMGDLSVKGLSQGSGFRWTVQNGQLVEMADTRPILRLSSYLVEAEQGSNPAPSLTVTRVDEGGNVVTTTGTVKITINGTPVNVSLSGGVGTLRVSTGVAREIDVGPEGPDYKLEAVLKIRIYTLNTV